jgi:hypothetical protein
VERLQGPPWEWSSGAFREEGLEKEAANLPSHSEGATEVGMASKEA